MDHWGLFQRSWSILWRNPALWVFGLLAALGGGGLSVNFNVSDVRPITNLPPGGRELLRSLLSNLDLNTLVGIGLVVGIVAFVLATFAQAALIRMVDSIAAGRPASAGDGFQAGASRFVPLLFVRFLLALPLLLLGILAARSFFAMFSDLLSGSGGPPFGLDTLGTFTALGSLSFVVSLLAWAVGISAERAVVLDGMPAGSALVRGWKWLWARFADYFTIALILLVLTAVAVFVFVCAFLPIFLASVIPSVEQLRPGIDVFTFFATITGPALIALLLLGLIFGSLAAVFVSSVWTLAYRHWRAPAPSPEPAASS